ncbi:MAG: 3-dehydroquinate synthase, partial [Myxococcota bacterium]
MADDRVSDDAVRVPVGLGARSYDILIGDGLLAQAGGLIGPLLPRPVTAIVTDATVAQHHLAPLKAALAAEGIAAEAVIVPPGEGSKSMTELAAVIDGLLALKIERDDLIIALGGGVVGDLAGFAAAILRRGVG